MSMGIYKYENQINSKVYIGQAVNIERRLKDHKTRAFNDSKGNPEYNSTLHRAIRKYSIENFSILILEECLAEELDEKEIFWIQKYDSYNNGYNETCGGQILPNYKFKKEKIEKVKYFLQKTNYNYNEISKKLNISLGMISEINTGLRYKDKNSVYPLRVKKKDKKHYCSKCHTEISGTGKTNLCLSCSQISIDLPEKMELAKLIVEKGFEGVGRDYGTSGNTIKKRCKSYGIPHLKKELKKWYQEKSRE